jgi:electron transfer flavoprotein beta subunit
MKFLVCISLVPDTTTKISFVDNDTKFNNDKVQWILNPYDEWYALVRALELKEANGGTVTVVNVGGAENDQVIRKALAIGATDAVRINTNPRDSFFVASQIADYISKNKFDLVLCGRESSDYNGSSVPVMIAELSGMPCVLFAKSLSVNGDRATLECEIEGGKEVIESPLPLVAGASEGMAEWKIPNMRGIMSARTKPLTVIEPVNVEERIRSVSFDKPEPRSAVKMIPAEDAGKLFDIIREETKII